MPEGAAYCGGHATCRECGMKILYYFTDDSSGNVIDFWWEHVAPLVRGHDARPRGYVDEHRPDCKKEA